MSRRNLWNLLPFAPGRHGLATPPGLILPCSRNTSRTRSSGEPVRQKRERVVRIISTSTVSIKSPRQISSSSCLRTAGVGSTGMSAAKFISSGVASVASASVQSVASASVASRSAFSVLRTASSPLRTASVELRSSSRVVSSASQFSVGVTNVKAFLSSGIVPSKSSAHLSQDWASQLRSVASRQRPVLLRTWGGCCVGRTPDLVPRCPVPASA